MRNFLRIILPPGVAFLIFAGIVKYYTFYADRPHLDGNSVADGLMTYFRYVFPLFILVALITQVLIVVPVWRNMVTRGWAAKITGLVVLFLICLAFAGGIGYAIWDKKDGTEWLIKTTTLLTGIQLAYWFIDILLLTALVEIEHQMEPEEAESEEGAESPKSKAKSRKKAESKKAKDQSTE